jgi:Na+-driven multidrug efflux pump
MEITDLIAVSDRPGAEFINDAETVRYGTMFLRARCFATPLMFLCFSMVHFTQAIGQGRDSFLLAVIRQLVFNIPLPFLFNHLFGVQGIVWTQLTADLFTVAVSYLIYFRIRKQEGWPVTI